MVDLFWWSLRIGCSDLYFVCLMRPVDETQALQAQASEIAHVRWMPLLEFLSLSTSKRFFAPLYDSLLLDLNSLYPSSGTIGNGRGREPFDEKLESAIAGAMARAAGQSNTRAISPRPALDKEVADAPLSPQRSVELYRIGDDGMAPSGLVPYATPHWVAGKSSALYYMPHRTAPRVRLT
jgi:hypothetical protein